MSGTVLLSAHRLPIAGPLRSGFEKLGYSVDLVADASGVAAAREPVLLVVTGTDGSGDAGAWLQAAESVGAPVFAVLDAPQALERAKRAGVEEAFATSTDPGDVVLLGHRTIQRRSLQKITGIVGESDSIREVLERVVQIGPVDSTVLITGESGTGKELVARGIHALSSRRHRSFLAVNVAAVTETLLESELFGHEKGAFTGAIDSRKGFFELAHKGTLFLDEIGEMPPTTQTKLLRVLEQRELIRVGGQGPTQVDVRMIAATNQNLRDLVRLGRFRRDLYYRLNILGIELPPLRQRREDVPRLVRHFVGELTKRMDRSFPGLSGEAMELLVRYDWPGNVRELRNLIESMVVLAPGRQIGPGDLPREIRSPGEHGRLLPVALPRSQEGGEVGTEGVPEERDRIRPELEFLFRTMVELKVDVDQLRRDFELYRDRMGGSRERGSVPMALLPDPSGEIEVGTWSGVSAPTPSPELAPGGGVVFRPGMTMDDLEAEAIRAVLKETGGNRRKAAESLGIGERTLYRKIHKYGIEE